MRNALLIDDRGNIVYSAYKDVDLGSNIINGPFSGSKLHDAYLKAMSANSVDYVGFTDFEFYQPAEMQPTAWMVAPIAPGGKTRSPAAASTSATVINGRLSAALNPGGPASPARTPSARSRAGTQTAPNTSRRATGSASA